MRVLVTGGAGFLGSHLCDALVARGDRVVALDDFDPLYPRPVKERNLAGLAGAARFELAEVDLRDPTAVERVLADGEFDVVAHLAARAGVRASVDDPVGTVATNVGGTAHLLAAMRRHGPPRLVFASSSSVYGDRLEGPFRETDPVDRPISPYAASKLAGEHLAHAAHAAHGFAVLALRFFSVYGPRQRPEMAIHRFTLRLQAGEPIPFFGDGSMERDYTYVSDAVAGLVAAVDRVPREPGYEVVNIGSGRPVRLDDLVARLGRLLGVEPVLDRRPAPPGDVRRTWADLARAAELLGYAPEVGLDDGLARFAEWRMGALAGERR